MSRPLVIRLDLARGIAYVRRPRPTLTSWYNYDPLWYRSSEVCHV